MRILVVLLILVASPSVSFSDDWTPPENPDVSAILREAKRDANSNRFETALSKHVWYHKNALKHDPAQTGVRLSFALGYWIDLGKKYPPALIKLQEIRDECRKTVLKGTDVVEKFIDMSAINDSLGESDKTTKLFSVLDKQKPKIAKKVYETAQPSLIASEEYDLCAQYIDHNYEINKIISRYKDGLERAKNGNFGQFYSDFVDRTFRKDSATLVALLSVTKKTEFAKEVGKKAKKTLDDQGFHAVIDQALQGKFPKAYR